MEEGFLTEGARALPWTVLIPLTVGLCLLGLLWIVLASRTFWVPKNKQRLAPPKVSSGPAPHTVQEAMLRRAALGTAAAQPIRKELEKPLPAARRFRILPASHNPDPVIGGMQTRTRVAVQQLEGPSGPVQAKLFADGQLVAAQQVMIHGNAMHHLSFVWKPSETPRAIRVAVEA